MLENFVLNLPPSSVVLSYGTVAKDWFTKKGDFLKTGSYPAVCVLNKIYNQIWVWAESGQHKPGKPFFIENNLESQYVVNA